MPAEDESAPEESGLNKKIYCAGPLFNQSEREEMQAIADCLETVGFDVFLPHRDGLEFRNVLPDLIDRGIPESEANVIITRSIFALDVYQVLDSDGLVFNLNGRVPDEGTMVEAGIAWSSGKAIVGYKNDARSLIEGSDNPLVVGLTDFELVDSVSGVRDRFLQMFERSLSAGKKRDAPAAGLNIIRSVQTGDPTAVCETLIREFGKRR